MYVSQSGIVRGAFIGERRVRD
ncbi:hypothetical protein ALC56_11257 [Trachymyrmex septentrionalis]|uniref:Uncharacterized protein n=1 Tax=Trachymyrmex septentrionalis TaxID=34720 RepID=A0A195F194_9HYME|nr:hypothetical protein ALC56_11257 [Trachymyrmex septentrionalis]